MCRWCGFPYSEVVDYAGGDTVCTHCGTVVDRDFQSVPGYDTAHCDVPEEVIYEESVRDRTLQDDVWSHLNVRCTFEWCLSRRDTAKVRKQVRRVMNDFPHLVFLHRPQDIVSAVLWILFPKQYRDHHQRPTPCVQKIANKLKDQCGL
jgi:hypothetical protein